jgi:hypothetical protein
MGRRAKHFPAASEFIQIDRRVDPKEAQQRLAERDARTHLDTRTPAQVWLNDPPPDRSALAQSRAALPQGGSSAPKRWDKG